MTGKFFKKPTSLQLVKEFPAFYRTCRFISAFILTGKSVPFLNQSYSVHASTSHFLRIHYNIILPSVARSSKLLFLWVFHTRTLYISLLFPIHTTCPPRLILLGLITWLVLYSLLTALLPCPSYAQISSTAPYSRTPSALLLLECERLSFTPTHNNRLNYSSVDLGSFTFLDRKLEDKRFCTE
jgi:hypothetical protein